MTIPEQVVPEEAAYAAAKAITGPLREPTEWELAQFKLALTAAAPHLAAVQVKWGELEEAIRLAEIGEYLYNRSYSYGDGYSEPREYGIEWQWQQTKPNEFGEGALLGEATRWHKEQAEDGVVTEASKLRHALRILSALEPSGAQERCRDCDGYNCDDGCAYQEPSAGKAAVLEEAAIFEALEECETYFENRSDADHDETGFVPNEEMRILVSVRAAIRTLSSPDHADAGKVEGDGWLPMTHPSLPKKGRFLAVATGEIERIAWNDPAAVVTVKAFDGPFVCYVHEDGAGFTDEFGEVYRADGIVIDAEDLTAADNVLRLTYWQPMPAIPSAPASEGAE